MERDRACAKLRALLYPPSEQHTFFSRPCCPGGVELVIAPSPVPFSPVTGFALLTWHAWKTSGRVHGTYKAYISFFSNYSLPSSSPAPAATGRAPSLARFLQLVRAYMMRTSRGSCESRSHTPPLPPGREGCPAAQIHISMRHDGVLEDGTVNGGMDEIDGWVDGGGGGGKGGLLD